MDLKVEASRTGIEARLRARRGEITGSNTGVASTDFRRLCLRNLVSLPLLEQMEPGSRAIKLASGRDISTVIPRYNIYQDGELYKEGISTITTEWSDQHVGFLIDCSFTLETALAAADLKPRNMIEGKAPRVKVSSVQLSPMGAFTGRIWPSGCAGISLSTWLRCGL
ncbi:uncharacterized protein DSM5745_01379 [Aspergillus mulundensis]|uniref:Uncharacterized protein n=1 Tax=Aspergillus mulundensis TaxID=1810919 RepID=A0A3D8T668_9EURO|nr:hypothetical protein DSM5745_01379 [Aspergillus mulundensis]RDW94057.1 hypothetical protein DSM5745_01379 [Aspergillus mulundensis]